jgi:large subunit ribosomal protein L9
MEVLLTADVKDLGQVGALVRVAEGYARNYLFPRKLAAPVTDATRRRLVKLQREAEERRKLQADEARALAEKLAAVSVTIPMKAGEGEKLFGSVTAAMVAEALAAQGFAVDKHAVLLEEPLRELGVFEVKVRLHHEVEATVKVWVVEE